MDGKCIPSNWYFCLWRSSTTAYDRHCKIHDWTPATTFLQRKLTTKKQPFLLALVLYDYHFMCSRAFLVVDAPLVFGLSFSSLWTNYHVVFIGAHTHYIEVLFYLLDKNAIVKKTIYFFHFCCHAFEHWMFCHGWNIAETINNAVGSWQNFVVRGPAIDDNGICRGVRVWRVPNAIKTEIWGQFLRFFRPKKLYWWHLHLIFVNPIQGIRTLLDGSKY